MRKSILRTIEAVRPFIPRLQLMTMADGLRTEERAFFREKFRELESTIAAIPVTYEQSELGDAALVHLHYFAGGADWWITEKDVEGGTQQAFGLVDLGHGPELGYISIDELVTLRSMNIDLHWKPCTLAALKEGKYGARPEPKPAPVAEPARFSVEMIVSPAECLANAPANGVYH